MEATELMEEEPPAQHLQHYRNCGALHGLVMSRQSLSCSYAANVSMHLQHCSLSKRADLVLMSRRLALPGACTGLGQALQDALQQLKDSGNVGDAEIQMINECYDKCVNDALEGEGVVKNDASLEDWHGRTKLTIKGHLQMFRGVDGVWTLVLNTGAHGGRGPDNQKVSVKVEPGDTEYRVDALKIVAMQKAA